MTDSLTQWKIMTLKTTW